MPIYAYKCQACGHEVEAIQKMSDAPLTDCPACNKSELKKMLTAPAFRLSGSGWYETDFKKDKRKNIAGDNSPASGPDKESKSSGDSSGGGESSSGSSGSTGSSGNSGTASADAG